MTLKEALIPFSQLDIVLVCGLPGSGKSYFSRQIFSTSGKLRINRTEIRKMIYEMTHFGDSWKSEYFQEETEALVKHTERKMIEQLLQTGHPVLIDNTSVTPESRLKYIEIAKTFKKSIGAIYLQTSVQKCFERNRQNQNAVPEIVISRLSLTAKTPLKTEGFSHIVIVPND